MHPDSILCGLVQGLPRKHWSRQQISLTLARLYPKGHEYRVLTETFYNCLLAMPLGEPRRKLIDFLRHAPNKHVPRSKGSTTGDKSLTC